MTGLVYKELPVEDITHLFRAEFTNGQEQKFYDALLTSVEKFGIRDPVYIRQLEDDTLKIIVGNNRMVIAKQLKLKTIKAIIELHDPNNNNINGKPINNEQEIIDLFYSKEGLEIKKKKGVICEVMPRNRQKLGKI